MLCAIQRLPFPESLCRVFQALFHSFQRQLTSEHLTAIERAIQLASATDSRFRHTSPTQ